MRKYLAADLGLAREKGFDYFSKSEKWPVEEREFHEFSDFIGNTYNKIILQIDNKSILDVALTEFVFVTEMINIFHYNYAYQYCLTENIKLISSNDSDHYLNPNWDNIGNYYSKLSANYSTIKGYIKNKIKNIVFNMHLPVGKLVHKFFTGSSIVGIGSNDRIKQEFIKNNRVFCDNRDGHEIIKNAINFLSKNKRDNSIDKVEIYIDKKIITPFICELQNTKSDFIKGIDWSVVKKVWLKRFLEAYKIYSGLILISIPESLLVTEVGKPHSKLISLAFQRKGCKVFNFHHGNDSGLLNKKWAYQSLFAHCNNYVVDTKVICNRLKKINSKQTSIRKEKTNFISVNSNYYANLRKLPHRTNSKKIMLMGFPMNLGRYSYDSYLFFNFKIKLENTLIDIMRDSGCLVGYKAHPDRLEEIKSVILVDDIVEQPFESVWSDAGVLVFTYVSTTTFCYALNLPIAIVLIEMPETPWYENMREIVEKRVEIVKTYVTDNQINICHNELINAINLSKNKVDLNVAEEITG